MVDQKAPPSKQGLHGWKAAAAVFGCGTLAAFGVFGVLVGVVSLFFNFTSDGIGTDPDASAGNPAEQIGEPRSSLAEEEMNVCQENLDHLSSINTTRQDGGEDYVDTATSGNPEIEGAERVVRDECVWTIIPSSNSTPWDFRFSYEAVIDANEGEDVEEVASSRYEELRAGISEELAEVESEGEAGFGEKSYAVYGTGEQGQSVYIALIQTRSAVYQIRFDEQAGTSVGSISENEFMNEARKIASFLGHGFEYWIPE
ncbi:hypothetical protein MRI28_24930 [Nocardiopsis dassonvillei]|uniref:hypothetical protein n=1 Tax=Nocardiopsis dassonvillei TaxID=2014 RepID=UPI00200F5FF4|nr:hypothetical protein [Nocardiopsis dassonvillei]MCK9872838.1 hypothetical protein [Nocardiopsis dassonvillei]